MLAGVGADKLNAEATAALTEDMRRRDRQLETNRYASRDANRLILREWLFGRRANAVAAMDAAIPPAAPRLADGEAADQDAPDLVLLGPGEFALSAGRPTRRAAPVRNCGVLPVGSAYAREASDAVEVAPLV